MEKAATIGNSRSLYQLIKVAGPRKSRVSAGISEPEGSLVHSHGHSLDRRAEKFGEQFSLSVATMDLPPVHASETI